jgi:hypothetical protein
MKHLCRKGLRCSVFAPLHIGAAALALLAIGPRSGAQAFASAAGNALPDAPSTVLLKMADDDNQMQTRPALPPPCPPAARPTPGQAGPPRQVPPPVPCINENPLQIVVNYENRQPLTSRQKGVLAVRDVVDPFNLLVIAAEAGVGVGANAHSPYGPGLKGFGRLTGYQLLQDTQGEFFGTWLIPSLVHEDPRYRRMQKASVKRRIFHALARTVIAEHDNGRPMLNYATLLTYPISAELSNLYVPGVQGNGRDTARRIGIGLATDPASNLISEFLPDFARRIHVRSVFIQQIVNNMALNPVGTVGP